MIDRQPEIFKVLLSFLSTTWENTNFNIISKSLADPVSVGAGRPVPPPRPLLRWLRQQADGRGGLQRGGRASGAGLHRQQGRAPQARELRQASTVWIKESLHYSFPTYFTLRKTVNASIFAMSKDF